MEDAVTIPDRPVIAYEGAIFADDAVIEPGPTGRIYYIRHRNEVGHHLGYYIGYCTARDLAPVLFATWRAAERSAA